MDRLFLDANVLFSAAYNPKSVLVEFWELDDVEPVTSAYAIGEARRNLSEYRPDRLASLDDLVGKMTAVLVCDRSDEVADVELAGKDRPILQAAITAGATHLITGDTRHFERLFASGLGGLIVQRPTAYLGKQKKGGQSPEDQT